MTPGLTILPHLVGRKLDVTSYVRLHVFNALLGEVGSGKPSMLSMLMRVQHGEDIVNLVTGEPRVPFRLVEVAAHFVDRLGRGDIAY